MSSQTKAGITVLIKDNIQVIRFNNPKKKNSIRVSSYPVIANALNDAAKNPDILFSVITGTGDYYSSGFEISLKENEDNSQTFDSELINLIDAFINYPKLLVAVVNGPAIGLACTTLALCDIVYASDTATFVTPFSQFGLCAEGCSSYTFPRILGKSKAAEVLLTGHKMTAQEAYTFGFVSKVYKNSELNQVWDKIAQFKNASPQSIRITKEMTRTFDRDSLLKANRMEVKNVVVCTQSEEFTNNIMKFLTRKSKL